MQERFVIQNANIITMQNKDARAQALAVQGSRIYRVGSNADVQSFIGQGWPVLDLEGQTVLPGFIDTHEHMMLTGLMAAAVHLNDVEDIDQLLAKIEQAAKQTPKEVWIRGSYFNE